MDTVLEGNAVVVISSSFGKISLKLGRRVLTTFDLQTKSALVLSIDDRGTYCFSVDGSQLGGNDLQEILEHVLSFGSL